MLHGAMETLSEEKPHSHIGDGFSQDVDRHLNVDAESLKHIRASTKTGCGPVSVLRDTDAGSGDNQGGGGRDVKGARTVPACATCVQNGWNVTFPERVGLFTHDARKRNQFGRG